MKKTTHLLAICIMTSCSSLSLSAKRLSPKAFKERIYRPCEKEEVKDYIGKVCHRFFCSKNFLGVKKTCLIIENYSDVQEKMIASGMMIISNDILKP